MSDVKRVGVYVDGNNLFYGALKSPERKKYRWLNLELLIKEVCDNYFLENASVIKCINFYTARVSNRSGNADAPKNQQIYFNALKSIKNLKIILGSFQLHAKLLPSFPLKYKANGKPHLENVLNTEEKGSDVNLASHLIFDSCRNKIDVAIVISNDTDLYEPIRIVAQELSKTVINVSPGRGIAYSLKNIKDVRHYVVGTTHLANSQFPDIINYNNKKIKKPDTWI